MLGVGLGTHKAWVDCTCQNTQMVSKGMRFRLRQYAQSGEGGVCTIRRFFKYKYITAKYNAHSVRSKHSLFTEMRKTKQMGGWVGHYPPVPLVVYKSKYMPRNI